jgi:hypothetical protein
VPVLDEIPETPKTRAAMAEELQPQTRNGFSWLTCGLNPPRVDLNHPTFGL